LRFDSMLVELFDIIVKWFLQDLGLSEWVCRNCAEMGIRIPTEVQRKCIGPILAGQDVIGQAKTGSGKTAAFALPILEKLSDDPYGVFAIVLTPSRELAFQIAEQFSAFSASSGFTITCVTGGMDMMRQSVALRARPMIVIATPGRLADHIRSSDVAATLGSLRFLVLDEADRLLEPGFAADMETVLGTLPVEGRQTLLFSATMTRSIAALQGLSDRPVFSFESASDAAFEVVEQLQQYYVFCPLAVKDCYLLSVLRSILSEEDTGLANQADDDVDQEEDQDGRKRKQRKRLEAASASKTDKRKPADAADSEVGAGKKPKKTCIVFVSTCANCQLLSEMLQELGVSCVALHSKINQARRLASLGKFKAGTFWGDCISTLE
jgi:ATP-dependent RNA helicase DDX49/DBP8